VKLLARFIVAKGIRMYAYIMAMQNNDRDIEREKGRSNIEQQIEMFFVIFFTPVQNNNQPTTEINP
jgi:hypothetical protein